MIQTLTSSQEAQLRQLELAETPEQSTSRMVAELAAHPELWETAELTAEAEMVDDEEALPGLALYITKIGRNNVALMQLATLWESLRLAGLMRCRSRVKADPALLMGNTVSGCRTPQLSQFLRIELQLELNADLFREYVQYIADRRLERIGLPRHYRSRNPFPWMSETIDLGKEKNFFERRVTEYRSGTSLVWE